MRPDGAVPERSHPSPEVTLLSEDEDEEERGGRGTHGGFGLRLPSLSPPSSPPASASRRQPNAGFAADLADLGAVLRGTGTGGQAEGEAEGGRGLHAASSLQPPPEEGSFVHRAGGVKEGHGAAARAADAHWQPGAAAQPGSGPAARSPERSDATGATSAAASRVGGNVHPTAVQTPAGTAGPGGHWRGTDDATCQWPPPPGGNGTPGGAPVRTGVQRASASGGEVLRGNGVHCGTAAPLEARGDEMLVGGEEGAAPAAFRHEIQLLSHWDPDECVQSPCAVRHPRARS